ncbi:hypothetical protein NM688_g4947 [Phlebia brevispora]|uniref:Uncharacterized protein n=1 Tax=Phlebia brevispora TaxID=194682 RepID=A0ACC1T1N6_9APHY|nr:hypothetical protein NM688_g4947 [Phlebia brevispora]
MDSTNSTGHGHKDMYLGRAHDSVTLMSISAQVCLLATLFIAHRFYREDKLRAKLYFDHKFSSLSKNMVTSLCFLEVFHAIATSISSYVVPASASFSSENIPLWSIKLSFSLTAVITLMCQTYVTHAMYQACNRTKWIWRCNIIWAVTAFLCAIGAIYFGPFFLGNSLGTCLSLVNVIVSFWAIFHAFFPATSSFYLHKHPAPPSSIVPRMHRFLSGLFAFYCLAFQLPFLAYLLYDKPSVWWAITDVATYELIGNTYPFFVIILIMMPGFESWEDDPLKFPPIYAESLTPAFGPVLP